MNSYTTRFSAVCPVNEQRIEYTLRIEAPQYIMVEKILRAVKRCTRGFHEDFANELVRRLGGVQTLTAEHHGVLIETKRVGK